MANDPYGYNQLPDFEAGPLSELNKPSKYAKDILKYPLDLGSNNRRHYINFYINESTHTSYSKDISVDSNSVASFLQGTDQNQQISSPNYTVNIPTGLAKQLQTDGIDIGGTKYGAFNINDYMDIPEKVSVSLNRPTSRTKYAISLYMPDTVNVSQSFEYDDLSVTEALGVAGFAGQNFGGSLYELKEGDVKKSINKLSTGAGLAESAGFAAQQAHVVTNKLNIPIFGHGVKDLAMLVSGYSINPQLALLFKSTPFRTFSFDFLMTARSKAETDAIREIIKRFNIAATPKIDVNGAGRYFIPPATIDVEYKFANIDNNYLNKISTCVITGIATDYAPNTFSTHEDGSPVQIRLTINLKEIEIIHQDRASQGY